MKAKSAAGEQVFISIGIKVTTWFKMDCKKSPKQNLR